MTRSEAELWAIRAKAAEDAAVQLTQLRSELDSVLDVYYMGEGCVEGQELHVALRGHFGMAAQMLGDSADEARKLAATCRGAAAALSAVDDENAAGFSDATFN